MLSPSRQGVVVWLTSLKYARQLRRFGHVQYVSKKMKYVVFYCDQHKVEETMEKLSSFHFVVEVQPSMRPFVNTDFQNAKPDKAKEYDYKLGI
ncbi:YlbG family protein [Shouchella shacheensis]|uniref:YlbG family protein n=1 Tax=Shouchella shacheensis TaxID=1649580 RepID=UPI00073FD836|nr:YlbG family protein [Shouchella shacheensis]